ncbi:MAG: hypothetical protein ACI4V5_05320, partial [Prevotella sp.]
MGKKVMLSLVAMTSASMAAYANADLSGNIKVETPADWGNGEGLTVESGILVSTGTPVQQTIGTLVKGKYNLAVGTKTTNVKLYVNGIELAANGDFELDGETSVTIMAESTNGQQFSIGDFTLELVFDFTQAYTTLNKPLIAAYVKLNDNDDFWYLELQKEYNATTGLAARIEAVKGDSYEVYKNEQLYEADLNNSQLGKDIAAFAGEVDKAVANKTAKDHAKDKIDELATPLSNLQSALNSASDYAKGLYAEQVTTLATTINDLKDAVDTSYENKSAATDYPAASIDETVNSLSTQISTLSTNISNADSNKDAYDAVKSKVVDVTTLYNSILQGLISTVEGDEYKDLLTGAQTELKGQYNKILEIDNSIGSDGIPASDAAAKKDNNIAALSAIEGAINNINTKYTGSYTSIKNAYDAAVAAVNTEEESVQKRLDAIKTRLDGAEITSCATEVSAVETAIAAVNT